MAVLIRTEVAIATFALAGFLALGMILAPAGARAECVDDCPDGILQCLSNAFANRDIEAYSALLASDFVVLAHDNSTADPPPSVDREAELAIHARLFSHQTVEALSLTFGPEYERLEGEEPGTWYLRGISCDFALTQRIEGSQETKVLRLAKVLNLAVRFLSDPEPRCELYRWDEYDRVDR